MKKLFIAILILVSVGLASAGPNDITTTGLPLLSKVSTTGASNTFYNVMADTEPTGRMKSDFTAGVAITGAPTTVSVRLEGSINGTDWVEIGTHDFTAAELTAAYALYPTGTIPVAYVRGNIVTLIGGSSPTVSMSVVVAEESNVITDSTGRIISFKIDQSGSEVTLPVTVVSTDQTQLNRRLMRFTGTTITPTVASSAGDVSMTFAATTGIAVGDEVFIYDTSTVLEEPDVSVVTVDSGTVLTFDGPLDNAYTTSATVELVSSNLSSVAGTLAAPITYKASPLSTEEWHVDRMIIHMEDNADMSDEEWAGTGAALTNGVQLFKTILSPAVTRRLANWKTNGDISHTSFDTRYEDKSGGGLFALKARWSFNKHQITHEIEGVNGDVFGVLIQDDFTGVSHIHVVVQGHREFHD